MAHKLYLNVGAGANSGDVAGRAEGVAGGGTPRPLAQSRAVGGQRQLANVGVRVEVLVLAGC